MRRWCGLALLVAGALAGGCRRGSEPGVVGEWRTHRTGRVEARVLGIDHQAFRNLHLFDHHGGDPPAVLELEVTNGTDAPIVFDRGDVEPRRSLDSVWQLASRSLEQRDLVIAAHARVVVRYWVGDPPPGTREVRVRTRWAAVAPPPRDPWNAPSHLLVASAPIASRAPPRHRARCF